MNKQQLKQIIKECLNEIGAIDHNPGLSKNITDMRNQIVAIVDKMTYGELDELLKHLNSFWVK